MFDASLTLHWGVILGDTGVVQNQVVAWLLGHDSGFFPMYEKTFRGSFFTGFLTLGSLLLSLNTFTLSTVKQGVYDKPQRQADYDALQKLDSGHKYFEPLINLSNVIYRAMCLAFVTSFLQVSLGLIESNLAALLCLVMAVVTFGFVGVALWAMRANLKEWQASLDPPKEKPPTPSLIKSPDEV